jgi:hypothetical protein
MYFGLGKIHSAGGPKIWSNTCIVSLSRICSAAKPDFKHSYRLICMSKLVVWVTRRKMGSLAMSFVYKVSGKVVAKFCQNMIYIGRSILPRNPNSGTGLVSDNRNSQITNHFGPFDRPSASWESYLPFGIRSFQIFGQSEAHMLRSVSPLFCSESEFSSNIDR